MTASRPDLCLSGRHILVVEDDYLTADDLCRSLEGLGARVVGPAPSVGSALALLDSLRQAPDAAVLDVNLGGEAVYPVAERLRGRGIPFVFVTGYDALAIDQAYAAVPLCEKPATEGVAALIGVLARDRRPVRPPR